MAVETLVALNVVDDEAYQAYRDQMMPILHRYGGGFGYDFRVSEVLRSETDAPINHVFTIHFPDEATKDASFRTRNPIATPAVPTALNSDLSIPSTLLSGTPQTGAYGASSVRPTMESFRTPAS